MRRDSRVKVALTGRRLSIGSWLSFPFPPIGEMMARAGFDWLVIDTEHGPFDVGTAAAMVQTVDLAGADPLVRVAVNDPNRIKQAMDCGAYGVVVPMVNTRADAELAVASTYYPPLGQRGAGLARAHDYGLDFAGYRDWLERNGTVVVQIEHIDAVGNLEDILNVDGVDGFIVGPYDLSASMGSPGDWENAHVREALELVSRVARDHAKPGGYHVVHRDRDELAARIDEGYRFIAYGDDMVFLNETVVTEGRHARSLVEGASG